MIPIFQHPFTAIETGATGSGKTQWLQRLLKNRKISIQPGIEWVLYCYGELNPTVVDLQARDPCVEIFNGVPSEEMIRDRCQKYGLLLLVLDDLVCNLRAPYLDLLFTRGSHNWGVSVILVTQHLFTKELKIARNNSHYLILMRNPIGENQVRNLAVQLFPNENYSYFKESFKDATAKRFSYLIVDMHPSTPEQLRLKTNIYGEESEFPIVYVPRSGPSSGSQTLLAVQNE